MSLKSWTLLVCEFIIFISFDFDSWKAFVTSSTRGFTLLVMKILIDYCSLESSIFAKLFKVSSKKSFYTRHWRSEVLMLVSVSIWVSVSG